MGHSVTKKPLTRAERRARKRQLILTAARKQLRSHGHERLSLRDVARSAGLSPAGMYEFFADREQLVATLGSEASARLSRNLRASTRGAPDPVERLLRLGLAYIAFAKRYRTDFMLLYGRLSRRRSLVEAAPAESEYDQILSAVAAVVGVERMGGADPRGLEALAYGFWSVMHGMAMLQLTHLAGFHADFATANRQVLASIAASWREMELEKILALYPGGARPRPKAHARGHAR
jgi:AcrR family transcriptional regulator